MISDLIISSASDENRLVFCLEGELDMASAPALRDAFAEHRAEDVTLDASGLTFVDSTGLSVLLSANRRWQDEGRSLRITNPSRPLRRLLELAGVDHVFEIDET